MTPRKPKVRPAIPGLERARLNPEWLTSEELIRLTVGHWLNAEDGARERAVRQVAQRWPVRFWRFLRG